MIEIVIAIVGSGALSALIAGVFQIISDKKQKMDERFKLLEKDVLRTQMLVMLTDYPDEKSEIMKLAKHYFGDLDGDWYMTDLFNKWIKTSGESNPEWFKS